MRNFKTLFFMLCAVFLLSAANGAATLNCDICGMTIPPTSRTHIVLHSESKEKNTLHICSLPCFKKAKKSNLKYTQIDVADFNNPQKLLNANKAFLIVKTTKIKTDLGELAMPPYFGAFETKKAADTALKKYDDGTIVEGIENALKE